MNAVPAEILAARRSAEELYSAAEVGAALDRMAGDIVRRLGELDPVVMVVMNGGMIPAGQLLLRLDMPLQVAYLHATRYAGATRGSALSWIARPRLAVRNRVVLVVDDIFDEGHTLAAILEALRAEGAREVLSAVLVDKRHQRKVAGLQADFVGLEVPDRYVFGYGMDYKEYLRNLPGIYAVAES